MVIKKKQETKKPISDNKTIEKQPSKGWDKKIHLHPKANTNGLKQNPQNINRKYGPHSKTVGAILQALKKEGYEHVTGKDIESAQNALLGVSEAKLRDIADDEDLPILLRSISLYLADGWRKDIRAIREVSGSWEDGGNQNQNITSVNINILWITPQKVIETPQQ